MIQQPSPRGSASQTGLPAAWTLPSIPGTTSGLCLVATGRTPGTQSLSQTLGSQVRGCSSPARCACREEPAPGPSPSW